MISPDDIQIRVRPRDDFTQELHTYVKLHTTVVIGMKNSTSHFRY